MKFLFKKQFIFKIYVKLKFFHIISVTDSDDDDVMEVDSAVKTNVQVRLIFVVLF